MFSWQLPGESCCFAFEAFAFQFTISATRARNHNAKPANRYLATCLDLIPLDVWCRWGTCATFPPDPPVCCRSKNLSSTLFWATFSSSSSTGVSPILDSLGKFKSRSGNHHITHTVRKHCRHAGDRCSDCQQQKCPGERPDQNRGWYTHQHPAIRAEQVLEKPVPYSYEGCARARSRAYEHEP